jgi:hypothetical protein
MPDPNIFREELKHLAPTPEKAVEFFADTWWYPDQLARTLQDVYGISFRKAKIIATTHVNPPIRGRK